LKTSKFRESRQLKLGFHISISGSIDQSFDRARENGCTTFQIFTRNPRAWRSKPLDPTEVKAFRSKHRSSKIRQVFSHMPYLPNLASPNEIIYKKSVNALIEETQRCSELGIRYIVTHIGSHVGTGVKDGKSRLIQSLGRAADEDGPIILLENDSGSGSHMGSRFEDIADLIKEIGSTRIGSCLDICHAYAAGYDLTTKEGLTWTLHQLGETIGFSRLKLVHLNDSVGSLGSRIDHHDHIGLGKIGEEGFRLILASQLSKRPMVMETPMDARRIDVDNMRKVRELAKIQ
jgi:deoxyribonuclease IV